jgi:hypothetical protein
VISDMELTHVNTSLTTLQHLIISDAELCRMGMVCPSAAPALHPTISTSFKICLIQIILCCRSCYQGTLEVRLQLRMQAAFSCLLTYTRGWCGVQGEVPLAHDTLPKLELRGCRGGRLVIRCNGILELVMQSCSFPSLSIHAPSLASLELRDCQKVSDAGLRAALTRLTSLTHLDISNSVPLSDETLREVSTPMAFKWSAVVFAREQEFVAYLRIRPMCQDGAVDCRWAWHVCTSPA